MGDRMAWRGFPLAFLGYGFLYAWGYVSWSTDALATQAVSGTALDLSWAVSATIVPAALAALAIASCRRDFERMRWPYAAAPIFAAIGSVLSVAYQHVGNGGLAVLLAVASGIGTGMGSALFGMLWSLALSRLNMATLEVLLPVSFVVAVLCTLIVPSMAQVPALVTALLLVGLCGASLWRARALFAGGAVGARWLEEGERPVARVLDAPEASVPGIARMLVFGVVAWGVMNVAPTMASATMAPVEGIDAQGLLGMIFAIAYALGIIRYAVRVDFQALALMTLPPLVLSMTLFAVGGTIASFWAGVLNVGLNSCCEIILILYFVRIAQGRPERRAFWLALGSSASYLGVLIGQLGDALCARAGVLEANPALFCLVVVCVYAFAMMLIPQRTALDPSDGEREPGELSVPVTDVSQEGSDAMALACERVAREFGLSAREAEVCAYLARGRSQTYIRDALLLSKNTVSTHVRRLYAKLGVHSKQELIDLVERRR